MAWQQPYDPWQQWTQHPYYQPQQGQAPYGQPSTAYAALPGAAPPLEQYNVPHQQPYQQPSVQQGFSGGNGSSGGSHRGGGYGASAAAAWHLHHHAAHHLDQQQHQQQQHWAPAWTAHGPAGPPERQQTASHHQPQQQHPRQQQHHHQQQQRKKYPLPSQAQQGQQQQQQQQQQPHRQGLEQPGQQQRQPRSQQQHQQAGAAGTGEAPARCPPAVAPADPQAAWQERLGSKVLEFSRLVAPTPEERAAREAVFSEIAAAAPVMVGWRTARALLFGSAASGLSLHSSDIDIVLTGVVAPDPVAGMLPEEKDCAVTVLRRLRSWAERQRSLDLSSARLVAHARVPVLKLTLSRGFEVDVSVGDTGGRAAAEFVASMCLAHPVLRPLVLVLKAMLREVRLHEVYLGGLGSWSLFNMALAHVLEEARAGGAAGPPPTATQPGPALLSFLRRFSGLGAFDYARDAVSVRLGGCIGQRRLLEQGGPFARPGTFLVLEDPLTGREVAGGSHRMADVAAAFGRAATRLEEQLARAESRGARRPAAAPGAREGQRGSKRTARGPAVQGPVAEPEPRNTQTARPTAAGDAARKVALQPQAPAADGAVPAATAAAAAPATAAEAVGAGHVLVARSGSTREDRLSAMLDGLGADAPLSGNSAAAGQREPGAAEQPSGEQVGSILEPGGAGSGPKRRTSTARSSSSSSSSDGDDAEPATLAEALAAGPAGGGGGERAKRRRASSSEPSTSEKGGRRSGGEGSEEDASGSTDAETEAAAAAEAEAGPWWPLDLVLDVRTALVRQP